MHKKEIEKPGQKYGKKALGPERREYPRESSSGLLYLKTKDEKRNIKPVIAILKTITGFYYVKEKLSLLLRDFQICKRCISSKRSNSHRTF